MGRRHTLNTTQQTSTSLAVEPWPGAALQRRHGGERCSSEALGPQWTGPFPESSAGPRRCRCSRAPTAT